MKSHYYLKDQTLSKETRKLKSGDNHSETLSTVYSQVSLHIHVVYLASILLAAQHSISFQFSLKFSLLFLIQSRTNSLLKFSIEMI